MINETYSSADGRKFKIVKQIVESGNVWIYYQQVDTLQQYHCLAEAFFDRFTRELT